MLLRAMIDEPLGPLFKVQAARDVIGFDQPGWVITRKATGLMIWTGIGMTMYEAAGRLLRHPAPVGPRKGEGL